MKEFEIFKYCSPEETKKIFSFMEKRQYNSGDLINKQGEPGCGLFLIESGSAQAFAALPGDLKVALDIFHACDFFGSVSLIEDTPYFASIFSLEKTCCHFLDKRLLDALIVGSPELAHKIICAIAEVLVRRLRQTLEKIPENLMGIPEKYRKAFLLNPYPQANINELIFEPASKEAFNDLGELAVFSENKLETLLSLSKSFEVSSGKKLFTTKTKGSNCFFVLSGAVQITCEERDLSAKLAVLGPGEFFGELAFLDGKERGVGCVVRDYVNLLSIERQAFLTLKNTQFDVYCQLYYLVVRSLSKLSRIIYRQMLRMKCEMGRTMDTDFLQL